MIMLKDLLHKILSFFRHWLVLKPWLKNYQPITGEH